MGRRSTSGDARTIGVTMAIAVATRPNTHARARAVDPIAQTNPAIAIAGPMTFRMSTRNSLSGVLGGLTMNACRRKRKASRKISRPR
jgi:hypothetical protein